MDVLVETGKEKTILIVDDETMISDLLKEILTQRNYNAYTAYSAKEAIEVLEKKHIDVVITDILMPDINGIELTKQILKNYPHIRVIVISGGGESGGIVSQILMDAAADFGAVQSLNKPFSTEQILAAVKLAITGN